MTQFQNEYVIVRLVNDFTAILLTWSGYIPSTVYRQALDKALAIAQQHQITKWISDIRLMKMLEAKDQEWAKEVWLPKAVSAGCYKKQAIIMAEDIFGQAAARNIIAAVNEEQIEIQYFNSLEEAKTWLLTAGD